MAGFFDVLFGGGAEREAADKDRAAAALYQTQGLGALQNAYNTGTGALTQGYNTGTGALTQGYNTGAGDLQGAIAAYGPLAALGQQYSNQAQPYYGQNAAANTMVQNALGLNGAAGNQAATSAFQTDPGYQFQLNQTLDALQRQRAMSGMGASGNAGMDAMNYASGLSNQQYQQWLNNLNTSGTNTGSMANTLAQMGLSGTGTAAAGQSQGYTNLANLAQQYGLNTANLAGAYGLNTANLANQYGQNQTGIYGNTMQTNVGANNLQAAGEAAGAKNLLGAGLSLASLAAGGGLGSLGSSLLGGASSLFGSSPSFGGGSLLGGDAWGGSRSFPIAGLSPSDYG